MWIFLFIWLLFCEQEDAEILAILRFINQEDLSFEIALFQREEHIRSPFSEEWISRYLDLDFFLLFRMSKETFSKLLEVIICPELIVNNHRAYGQVSIEKALMMTLWWLGRGEVLNSIADRFNVVPSTVYHYAEIVVNQLCNIKNVYIQWPNKNERIIIEEQFRTIYGFPGVIGAIDGCNICIKAPMRQQESYIDKNSNHSIKLQAVATATKIFTNINVGYGGSVHDSRVFRNSKLYIDVENNGNLPQYFSDDYHLLGDKAYPLLQWLLTPYKDNGNLTRIQSKYNTIHSKTRIKVEHTFGILKGRFRILKYINVNDPVKATKIITACCVLHNYCYQQSYEWFLIENIDEVYEEEINLNPRPNIVAAEKRNRIAQLFI